jgi:cellulose biosynthesis protein BcsQ
MKKLILITQSKGGAGKSILTYLLAEKYPDAKIFDMDDATKTTTLQLAYRNPVPVTFLNSNNVIDRGMFNSFLEALAQTQSELFIADLGASVSEQLPYYFEEVAEYLPDVLKELGIQIEVFAIVGGANIFAQTMAYLESLHKSVQKKFDIKIYKNEYYEFTDQQSQLLADFAKTSKVAIQPFNISKDKNESTQNRIREVLKSGEGLQKASAFSKMYFQSALKTIHI